MQLSSFPLSRRGLLGAFAGAAGATMLGPAALASAAATAQPLTPLGATEPAALPTAQPSSAATVTTWLPCFSFIPAIGTSTYTYEFTPGLAHNTALGEFYIAQCPVRSGRTVGQITAYADPGGKAFTIRLLRLPARPTTPPVPQQLGQASSSTAGLQTIVLNVNQVLDAGFIYLILVGFATGGQFHGVDISHDEAPNGFVPATQTRKLDTRSGSRITAGSIVTVDLAPEIPGTASAAVITLTATETQGGGFLTAFPSANGAPPDVSTLNWTQPGQDVATTSIVTLQGVTTMKVSVGGQSGTATHILVDTVGYFT